MNEHLLSALQVAIPVEQRHAALFPADCRAERLALIAKRWEGVTEMEHLLFGGKHCTEVFASLAEAVALLSFRPGGIVFAGHLWQAPFDDRDDDDLDPWEREHQRNVVVPSSVLRSSSAATGHPERGAW